jgi:hypothetical protein
LKKVPAFCRSNGRNRSPSGVRRAAEVKSIKSIKNAFFMPRGNLGPGLADPQGALETEIVHGRVAKRGDDFAYFMLDPLDRRSDDFARGQILGQDQERKPILRVLHDDALSPHPLVAMFTVRGVQEKVETKGRRSGCATPSGYGNALKKVFVRIADTI